MTIKERKRILYFLETLMVNIESVEEDTVNPEFLNLFSRKELVDMVLWLHTNYDKSILTEKTDAELLTSLSDDANVLAYVIEKWKADTIRTPTLSQEEVHEFFDHFNLWSHYLKSKPVESWDAYDVSNYYSILYRHGKTRRVFAIFTTDVRDEDKYVVTTEPSYFFDTEEEAQEEIQRCIEQENFTEGDLKVLPLWKIDT
ncbi:conserved protein of unknown function [Tenacibaculum sp. 190524A02b]|uniref:hypothetical protein n=1 Tax=Tenacibaculum vairaonense TaxID=3137860 RepID=UPI0032B1BD04